jgi:beta-lactamase class A
VIQTRRIRFAVIAISTAALIGGGLAIYGTRGSAGSVTAASVSNALSPSPTDAASGPAGQPGAPSASPSVSPSGSPPVLAPGAFAEIVTYLRDRGTHTAVAAQDLTTGATVLYNQSVGFHTASIVKVDILATLLLQHQHAHTKITGSENSLAVKMITESDNDAANSLWRVVGGSAGVSAANKTFHLTGTRPGPGGDWGSTITTAGDQLRLLKVLATSDSPLSASSRAYELGLMNRVVSWQRWGVPTAAGTHASKVYNKNGWFPFSADGGQWTINSLGEIVENGHTYLVAVLSNNNSSEESGEDIVGGVATIAVTGLGGS